MTHIEDGKAIEDWSTADNLGFLQQLGSIRSINLKTITDGCLLQAGDGSGIADHLQHLDTPIMITGTGFTAELSGTSVLTYPTAYLGATALQDVAWVNSTTVSATVQWGLDPGVYTLTEVNPDGGVGSLPSSHSPCRPACKGGIVGWSREKGTPWEIEICSWLNSFVHYSEMNGR